MRTIDRLYVSLANRKPFFSGGWGDSELIRHLLGADPRRLNRGPGAIPPIRVDWTPARTAGSAADSQREGRFGSPFRYEWRPPGGAVVTHELPPVVREGRVQLLLPRAVANPPLVLHFAATGDEGFGRRRMMLAEPLLRAGIASAILENPYYGSRRLPGRDTANSDHVTELLQMSRAAQDEGLALLRVFAQMGFRALGVTGVSMGGYMALAVSARYPGPLAVAACIPTHSAAPVYTEGVLSRCCDWAALERHHPWNGRGPDRAADGRPDTRALLRDILDLSDLRHLPRAPAARGCVIVGGRRDAYIPAYSTRIAHQLQHATAVLRWIDMGHVTSFVLGRRAFVDAIRESFARLPESA